MSGETEVEDPGEPKPAKPGATRKAGGFAAPMRRMLPFIAAIVLLALVPLGIRLAWEGAAELDAARVAAERGRDDDQIVHLGRAARWRMPIARHDDRALDRLMSLGEVYEKTENRALALAAYREARRAILATRSWRLPHPEIFHEANGRIAGLMAEQERDFGRLPEGDPEETAEAMEVRRQWHLEQLEVVPGPDPVGSRIASICFVLWVVAGVGFVVRGLDAQGRLRMKSAVRWGVACLCFMVVWMVLMRYPQLL